MAEHKLLSSIYIVINGVVSPKTYIRGNNGLQNEIKVESLQDLLNGKKLSKLLKCEPNDKTPQSAKEAVNAVIAGFFHKINQISAKMTVFWTSCENNLNVLLVLVVIVIKIADHLKKIPIIRRRKIENELNFIEYNYYNSAFVSFKNILNRKSFTPLLDVIIESESNVLIKEEYSEEQDMSSQSDQSLSLNSLSDTENVVTNELPFNSSQTSSVSSNIWQTITEDISREPECQPLISEMIVANNTHNHSHEEQTQSNAIAIANQCSAVSLTPPTTPQTYINSSTNVMSTKTFPIDYSEDSESDDSQRRTPIKIKINGSFAKYTPTLRKRKSSKCDVECKSMMKMQNKVIKAQKKLLKCYEFETQRLVFENQRLALELEAKNRENNVLKDNQNVNNSLEDIFSLISDCGLNSDSQIQN